MFQSSSQCSSFFSDSANAVVFTEQLLSLSVVSVFFTFVGEKPGEEGRREVWGRERLFQPLCSVFLGSHAADARPNMVNGSAGYFNALSSVGKMYVTNGATNILLNRAVSIYIF